ncbi:MAG TPA: carbohydrate ABC transporter permease [Acetivibrio clariflavus]|nr:carbohydrate ABC transporter permease [Acetivibrio clariflavus]
MYIRFRNKRYKLSDVAFHFFNTIILLFLVVVTIYPFLNTLAISFNDGLDSVRGGIYIWPRKFSLQNYRAVFISGTVVNAFFVSVARTVITVALNVFLTGMLAYCLSRKEYIFNKFITVMIVITMYFNAGLIPNFLLIKKLGLYGSFWVYVIPCLISGFNVIVVRTYISSIPESLVESARLDGAGDFKIFLRIIFPLCKPSLAVIAMFVAIFQWNNWFDTYLYCSSKQSLSTLSYELQKLLASSFSQSQSTQAVTSGLGAELASGMVTPIAMQAAITIVAMVPIICVYPFVQRYFVTGLNVGGVKE